MVSVPMSQGTFDVQLPDKPKGRPGETYYNQVAGFARSLEGFDERVSEIMESDRGLSARGYAYLLEGENLITKGEIDYAEKLINKIRKNDFGSGAPWDNALLPTDFTARDDARQWYCTPNRMDDDESPKDYLRTQAKSILNGWGFDRSFWAYQDYFIQVLVEKIDLVTLFRPVCKEYGIPITTGKGWSTINQRADILSRFAYWEDNHGCQPVLLYCGDFDPVGVKMSDNLGKNLTDDLADALVPVDDGYVTGWDEYPIHVDRFGLNEGFVFGNDLTWIDNLETGSQRDLCSPSHPDHEKPYVQDWLDEYGCRKVEANAMVKNASEGRQLFENTVSRYLGDDPKAEYRDDLEDDKEQIAKLLKDYGAHSPLKSIVDQI